MPEITGKKLKLETVDSQEVRFVNASLVRAGFRNIVESVTVDRFWWENNGKPLEVDVEVKIS